jgi:hypothetical protein
VDARRHVEGRLFPEDDLPADVATRDAFLLAVMGSPDPRQIDGMGGADPLTSKVAVVSKSPRGDRCRLPVPPGLRRSGDRDRCAELRQYPGRRRPFAIERGLVAATGDETRVAIFMENTGQVAVATVQTPGGTVTYAGEAAIDGVPGTMPRCRWNSATRRIELRRAAAQRQRGGCDPRRGRDADRQWHALRGDEGARPGHHRL